MLLWYLQLNNYEDNKTESNSGEQNALQCIFLFLIIVTL